EYLRPGKKETRDMKKTIPALSALAIGMFQTFSIIPGVSRAAATIIGGLLMGLSREEAVEFSFFLAIPTMIAATGLDLVKTKAAFSGNEFILLGVGFLGAFFTALIAIKVFLKFLKTHSFIPFGVYRVMVALVLAALLH